MTKQKPEIPYTKEKESLERLIAERTAALEIELADRKKAENKLISSLDKITRNRKAILNLLEDLKSEINERKLTEKALNESETRFRQVAEIAGEWIWEVDKEGVYTYISRMGESILGYPADEIIGKKRFYDFFDPEIREELKEAALKAFSNKEIIRNLENLNIHRDGHKILLETTGIPILDESGSLLGYRGVDRDITERKSALKELNEAKERFSSVFEYTPIGLYRTTPDGRIVMANPELIKMLGFSSREELLSRNLENEGFEPGYSRAMFIDEIESTGRITNLETTWTRKDKSVIYIRENAVAVKDEAGKIIFYEGNVADITKSKLDEKALIDINEFNQSLLKTIPFGMDIVDETGTILFQSENFQNLFGETSIGKKCWELYRDDKSQCGDCPLCSGITIGKTDMYESAGVLGGRVFEISHTGMIFQGKKAMLEIFMDITERKKAEEELISARNTALESDRLKTAFLHNISHEIRTPMNAIIGFSNLLSDQSTTVENQKSYLEIIMSSSNQLLAIVNDIIEISNIEAGILKTKLCETNLNIELSLLLKQFSGNTAEKGVGISFEAGLPDDQCVIVTDSTKVIQILSNLINNAIKFTDSGRIIFGYKAKNSYLEFYVSDTGIGIEAGQFEKIFDRFYQVEQAVSRLYEGTGLGLSISKAYVELLGGRIWLTSQPGNGTTFFFTIPLLLSAFEKKNEILPDSRDKFDLPGKKTILIAEDEENNFMLLSEMLSKLNLNIMHARDGKEALDICRSSEKIDLILMDIKMPVMDGYEATREIRKFLPGIPVIAQTAYAFGSDREKALEAGCNDYISKPMKRETLLLIINKYL
jgi:PAS domain S-box-containing protein